MDDMLLRITKCLLHVLRDHGREAYHRAGQQALSAICKVLIEETEGPPRRQPGKIVRLPLRRRLRHEDD